MVYTVYKGVDLGLSAVAADFHNTAQIINVRLLFSSGGTQIDYP